MRRLALSLLTCLALLRPDAVVAATCHQAEPDAIACCDAACGCCERAGDSTACCCESDDAPVGPVERRAPPPTSTSTELERALCLPGSVPDCGPMLETQEPRPARAARRDGPTTTGRALLRQGCRLRH